MIKTVLQTLRRFENVWLYIGFLIVAGFLAASRGCSQEFFTVLFFPAMIPVLLSVVMLLFCAYRGANGRILLLVLIMLALAGLMRAVFWTSYPELFEGSKLTIPDYLLVQIVMFAVMLIYPMRTSWKNQRIFEILAGRKCTLAMLILIAVMYALLLLSGDSYSGVRAWFTIGGFSIQLTEFIKLLFIICLAAMMSRDEKAPLAILFYIVNAVLMGAVISEFGTVMVMTFVFIFFLFIFPQKKGLYFVVSLIALLIVVAAMGFLRMSSREYDYALEKSDPRVFAAKFAGTLYDYAMDTPEDVVTMDILGEMVNKSLSAMDTEKQAEFGRAFHSISNQIADGQLKLSDFAEARDSDILEKVSEIVDAKKENGIGPETAAALTKVIEKYPAVSALARLCEDDGFRTSYIMQFCREEFYSTGMLYVDSFNICDPAKSCDLALYCRELLAGCELAVPGFFILCICHVIVGMVACYYHQRSENDLRVSGFCYLLDHCIACGVFGLAFYSSDEYVVISECGHLCLHLAVCDLCIMRRSMSHEHERYSCFLCCRKALILAVRYCCCYCCLGYCFLVCIDFGRIRSYLSEQRLCYKDFLDLALIVFQLFDQLIILCSVHQVRRLYYQRLDSACYGSVQCLLYVVDLLAVSGLYVVDDDLSGERSSDRPVRICFLQGLFDSADISSSAVIE